VCVQCLIGKQKKPILFQVTEFSPPASSSLTHTRRMDGFCNQNGDLLGSLAGLSFPVIYVGVVECAPASPYTSSSTHRFPDERTPIEATPLSTTSAEGFGTGFGIGFTLLLTRSSPSRHPSFTQYPSPSRSLVRDGQTSPHKSRLVVPHITCFTVPLPPLTQLYNRSCSNKHTHP